MAASIRGRSWRTGPGADIEVADLAVAHLAVGKADSGAGCPSRLIGQPARIASQVGIRALRRALRSGSSLMPKPSRTQRTTGRGTRRPGLRGVRCSSSACQIDGGGRGRTDGGKTLGIERGTADQGPVHVGLAKNSAAFAAVTLPP